MKANLKKETMKGEGILYDTQAEPNAETGEQQKLYQGEWKKGKKQGAGKLYDSGNLLYDGNFEADEYSGEGILYSPLTSLSLYEGNFRLGLYDGAGKLYNELGELIYEGEFQLGLMNGEGTSYDGNTGIVLEEGIYRKGVLVTSRKELEIAREELNREESSQESDTEGETEDMQETEESVEGPGAQKEETMESAQEPEILRGPLDEPLYKEPDEVPTLPRKDAVYLQIEEPGPGMRGENE